MLLSKEAFTPGRVTMFSSLLVLAILNSSPALAAERKACTCKCVTKDEEGKYTTQQATGKDREESGEKLKKKLKDQKCELSPVCEGKC